MGRLDKSCQRIFALEPNAETIAALEACRRGKVMSFNNIEDLMLDLNADD
ncbi:MAG: hypothetical protein ACNA7G_04960 [Methylobacter sp.]